MGRVLMRMYEHHKSPLLPWPAFLVRVAYHAGVGILIILICLGLRMLGYHYFEGMPMDRRLRERLHDPVWHGALRPTSDGFRKAFCRALCSVQRVGLHLNCGNC